MAQNIVFYPNPAYVNQPNTFAEQNTFNGQSTFAGAITVGARGNVAAKPIVTDGVQHVTAEGSDSNDGLSWGTAKASIQAAYNALPSTGGTIHLGAGNFAVSSTIIFSTPVWVVGNATTAKVTFSGTGACFLFGWGAGASGYLGGVRGVTFIGPGSTTKSYAVQLGSSTLALSGAVVENCNIGIFGSLNQGFGTGIYVPSDAIECQNCQIINNIIQNCGTAVQLTGELHVIRGGNFTSCTTAVKIVAGDVSAHGVSFDSHTGTYIVNGGTLGAFGCHWETNDVPLAAGGFVQNSSNFVCVGGQMLNDNASGAFGAFVTSADTYVQVRIHGTIAWSNSGSTVKCLVSGPSGYKIEGTIDFNNEITDNVTPQFDGTSAGVLTVRPSAYTGGSAPAVDTINLYHQSINVDGNYYVSGRAGVTEGPYSAITSVAATGGIITTLADSSDERLKTNFKPFTRGLAAILEIVPQTFTWNEKGRKITNFSATQEFSGYTAQALQKGVPEAVHTSKTNSEYLGIEDRPVIAALINAVKELKALIDDQHSLISTLTAEVASLKSVK